MRICHVNLSRELRGGEYQTIALVQALAESLSDPQLEQTLVVRRDSDFHQYCRSLDGFDLRPVPPSTLRAMAAARDADVVHIHEGRSARVGALLSLAGIPFAITRRIPKRPKDLFLTRWIYSRAATIACVSNHVAEVMHEYAPNTPIETVYDCIRPLEHGSRRITRSANGELLIGIVGEIDFSHKGQDIAAAAARILAQRGSDARFLIAGTGRDEPRLREMTRDLANFEYLGWVEDIGTLLSTVDAVAHPARKEGLGSVLLEAMSCGKPVVASRVGGIPEIVEHDKNGLLFKPESAEDLADCITRLENEPELIGDLAGTATQVTQRFLPKQMARSYLEMYEQLATVEGIAPLAPGA